jgi:DNA-binding PadR family transcriptional regulator
MFLFGQLSKAPAAQKYAFKPYHYGPFSFAIYPDLDDLTREGMIRAEPGPIDSVSYTLTPKGQDHVAALRPGLPGEQVRFVHGLREWVMQRGFRQLLTDIYRLYPDYAVNSIFR